MQRLYSKPKNTYPKPEEFIRAGYVDVLHKTLKKEEDFTLTKEEVASMATLNKDIEVHIECDLSCYSDGYGEVDEIDIYF
ncbi:hypothetical protein LRR18_16785, partial [Mangrovimonas sp. AS39]|uniref:hypothetical protein n=1 Tax=Mangrovimonas futianensis TaxID=2895523 RepID=UPI001E2FA668